MTDVATTRRDATWAERGSSFILFFVTGLAVGVWAAALPALKSNLALSDRDLSLVLFCLSVGSVVSTILTGFYAGRIGTGRTTAVSSLVLIGALSLPPLAGTLAQFAVAAVILGASIGALDVAMNGHASHIEQRWGGPIMSSFHGAFSLGGLAGSALGGLIANAEWGVAAQFWIPVGIAAVGVVAALPTLGRGPERMAGFSFAWPQRSMLALCITVLFCFIVEGAIADWSAVYMTQILGTSVAMAAGGYAAFSVAMATVRLTGDRVVEILGPWSVVVGGSVLAALGLGLAVAVAEPIVAILGFALVGIGAANIIPIVFSAAARTGTTPVAGVAMVSIVGYAGFVSGPPLMGTVATAYGLRTAVLCLAFAAVLMTLAGGMALQRKTGSRD